MNVQNAFRHGSPLVRRDPVQHLYAIGQSVRLTAGFYPSRVYRIMSRLPVERDSVQYRIRSDEECHERVAAQESLELIKAIVKGKDLIDKTFGRD